MTLRQILQTHQDDGATYSISYWHDHTVRTVKGYWYQDHMLDKIDTVAFEIIMHNTHSFYDNDGREQVILAVTTFKNL